MAKRLRTAAIAAVIAIIAMMIFGSMQELGLAATIVLMIAVIGFFTIVFVMIIGAEHDHYPVEAKDSASVAAWTKRLAQSEQVETE